MVNGNLDNDLKADTKKTLVSYYLEIRIYQTFDMTKIGKY